jgi:hypothetical protein
MTARARRRGFSNPITTTRNGRASESPITSTGILSALAMGRPMIKAKMEEIIVVDAAQSVGE